jgi:iron complex transport system ATP-binding protein
MSLEVSNLSFSYTRESRLVLNDVSFNAKSGDLLAVLGPNGVGKSTLFRCILGFLTNYSGQIRLNGTDLRKLDSRSIARMVAYIPQSTYPAFNFAVLDLVLMGMTNQIRLLGEPKAEHVKKALAAMKSLGIEKLKNAGYGEISGGERQLALIARALVQDAKILIMDEPTANLDYGNQIRVMKRIQKLADAGYLIIMSTHNPEHAFLYANRVLVIKEGRVIADGMPDKDLTAGLIRTVYGVEVHVDDYQNICGVHKICVPVDADD